MSDLTDDVYLMAILMAQELQEIVDDAIECSGDRDSMLSTQRLIREWDRLFHAMGVANDETDRD